LGKRKHRKPSEEVLQLLPFVTGKKLGKMFFFLKNPRESLRERRNLLNHNSYKKQHPTDTKQNKSLFITLKASIRMEATTAHPLQQQHIAAPRGRRTPEGFAPYCVFCNRERLPSSSNAKFSFDYCLDCKKIQNFSSAPQSMPHYPVVSEQRGEV